MGQGESEPERDNHVRARENEENRERIQQAAFFVQKRDESAQDCESSFNLLIFRPRPGLKLENITIPILLYPVSSGVPDRSNVFEKSMAPFFQSFEKIKNS